MEVTFLGTGSALPDEDRAQTGILVRSEDRRVLIDCGAGVLHRLQRAIGVEAVDTVLLSHHHIDHCADLLPLLKARWLAGEETLSIAGPAGTKSMVTGLLDVHEYLQDRINLTVREITEGSFSFAGFAIDAMKTRHSMDCYAYRLHPQKGAAVPSDRDESAAMRSEQADTGTSPVSHRGSFVFSGDSEAFDDLADFADGCSLLAHDCSFPDGVDVSNHPTPSKLGQTLTGIDIERVLLTHLYPQTGGKHAEMIAAVESSFDGEVGIAHDLMTVTV